MSGVPTSPAADRSADPAIGDRVDYIERGSYSGAVQYQALVAAVRPRVHHFPLLDLACTDRLGRTFARTRVEHASHPTAPAVWRLPG